MLRRIALASVLPGAVAFGSLVGVGTASAAPAPNVMVCHFAGNTAPSPWHAAGTTLTGDYVLTYTSGGPAPNQIAYCTDHGGIGVISVNANSLKGHGAQLTTRVATYPSGPGRSSK